MTKCKPNLLRSARARSLKGGHGRLPGASGRKWRIRAPHIRPQPRRGPKNATNRYNLRPFFIGAGNHRVRRIALGYRKVGRGLPPLKTNTPAPVPA